MTAVFVPQPTLRLLSASIMIILINRRRAVTESFGFLSDLAVAIPHGD